jgi:hypothetical protein
MDTTTTGATAAVDPAKAGAAVRPATARQRTAVIELRDKRTAASEAKKTASQATKDTHASLGDGVKVAVPLEDLGIEVLATAFTTFPRTVDRDALAGLVPSTVLDAVTECKVSLEKFDAAVKLGLITPEMVEAVVSTPEVGIVNVNLTERAIRPAAE